MSASQQAFLDGPEFDGLLRDRVTEAVAEAVTLATEAAIARITALERDLAVVTEKLAVAEQRVEELETQQKSDSVVISGVPEMANESTDGLVLDVGRAAGVNLPADSLDKTLRLGQPKPGKARPILVKFATKKSRDQIYEKRKELSAEKMRDSPSLSKAVGKVFISENLTPKNQHLLYVARQLRKRKTIWAAYTANGVVKIKKTEDSTAATIRDLSDLSDLVGEGALREFRPRGPAAAGPAARRGADLTWQATDAVTAWVTERRRGRSSRSPSRRGDGSHR